ncbi:11717_t:CDS:1 [Acaulospora colombiana]|uniref:11717_t:CDS:1 n=1 Tax=Acaulospora colombiana TaxID=27376 RepID=A0ACA9L6M6_9GLOM|nr:11717_t:CDS:1 [Acaulospora colombiana]
MSRSSSRTSSNFSFASLIIPHRNKPPPDVYIKTHKNITVSFGEDASTFQQGNLGDTHTYLVGTVHLNYLKACAVKNVCLRLKGKEKTSWYSAQSRSKIMYTGEQTIFSQTNKIWEAFEETEDINTLDIPFKMQLPQDLQETIITEVGSVQYVLYVTVQTKGLLGTSSHTAKIRCPLKRTLTLDYTLSPPYRLCGESATGIEYTLMLPPQKYFNAGSHISIPVMLRFLRSDVGVERLEVTLKTLMDFSCSQNEIKHVERQESAVLVELQSNTRYPLGGYIQTVDLFIPNEIHPTYQGRFINISHQLSIKFYVWGFGKNFCVEEYVRVAHVVERDRVPSTSALLPSFSRQSTSAYVAEKVTTYKTRSLEQFAMPREPAVPDTTGNRLHDDIEYKRLVAPFDDRFDDGHTRAPPPRPLFTDIRDLQSDDTFANIQTPLSPPPYRRLLTHQASSGDF